MRKVFERGFKSVLHDPNAISVAPPSLYSDRFLKFMTHEVRRGDDRRQTAFQRFLSFVVQSLLGHGLGMLALALSIWNLPSCFGWAQIAFSFTCTFLAQR